MVRGDCNKGRQISARGVRGLRPRGGDEERGEVDQHLPDHLKCGVDFSPTSCISEGSATARSSRARIGGVFGLKAGDALGELRRISLRGELIVQSAGGVTQVSWKYKSMDELVSALAQS